MVEFGTQIDKFKADITSHLKKSETQRQIQADIQTQKNQENINQLQKTMNKMIQISLQQKGQNTMAEDGTKNSTKSIETAGSNQNENTAGSCTKWKRKSVVLLSKKKRKARNLQVKIKD